MVDKLKAVLFDLDGVLVDACTWHYEALNQALKEVTSTVITKEEHVTTFNGLPTRKKLDILEDEGRIVSSMCERIFDLKQVYTISSIEKLAKPRQEKIELFDFLKSNKILIGCVTNCISQTSTMMLEKSDLKKYLDVFITNEDVENPKPSPEPYNKAMKVINAKPEETIVVEDSPKGILAAIRAETKLLVVSGSDEVNIDLLRGHVPSNISQS